MIHDSGVPGCLSCGAPTTMDLCERCEREAIDEHPVDCDCWMCVTLWNAEHGLDE